MHHRSRRVITLILGTLSLVLSQQARAADSPLEGVRRVLFLGDSITYAGQYIEYLEAILRSQNQSLQCDFLNLGLPSETVSGLTEPGHADGKFPRPDLHERLDRVLTRTKPDLVVVCYGMNDGIYYPFGEDRFKKFQEGIRFVHARIDAIGAQVLHLTPPVFDPVPILDRTLPLGLAEYRQPYKGYDEVLDRYSRWLLSQKDQGWDVVDLHGPIAESLAARRKQDPAFRFAGDGVHMDSSGHWIIAREILRRWNISPAILAAESGEKAVEMFPQGAKVLKLVQTRQRLMKDAWLSATGHTRPGMKQGIPLDAAERRAAEVETELAELLPPAP